jgi:hypothetical protein
VGSSLLKQSLSGGYALEKSNYMPITFIYKVTAFAKPSYDRKSVHLQAKKKLVRLGVVFWECIPS